MRKINYGKVILITLFKVMLMVAIFFFVNNWVHVKESFSGKVPPIGVWLNHALTLSNLVFIVVFSFIFYLNTLTAHKKLLVGDGVDQ